MNAQTIQDNVNKYRYGVLIGNVTEERFGIDMSQRYINEKLPNSTMRDTFGIQNSALVAEKSSITDEEKEFQDHVLSVRNGVQQHILFGHGSNFQKREYGTKTIPEIGQKSTGPAGKARAYNEFTKQYDSSHMKIPFRKQ
ncbi:hypothetical protein IMG5_172410 [Ichthyophthirius multifiliis]|uniref:Uncharacterized protein n=1 Tax=Ichthyophthirius multifiliis TaxID=5932 RepID=G0R1R7_ICHMU|nr:hypothetical protein IMG5_172410 [Ichthyophthirius multifiliis]EGR28569.1 hypothetical protein IMG5_172410 [Ichthyophthirius multifiliis]|eukprot:XP_004029805.1 hypothetical protein IMG5_172410 [Ichthyophthirius multifiliis]